MLISSCLLLHACCLILIILCPFPQACWTLHIATCLYPQLHCRTPTTFNVYTLFDVTWIKPTYEHDATPYCRGRQPLACKGIFHGMPGDLTRTQNLHYKRAVRTHKLKLSTLHEINSLKICQNMQFTRQFLCLRSVLWLCQSHSQLARGESEKFGSRQFSLCEFSLAQTN